MRKQQYQMFLMLRITSFILDFLGLRAVLIH
nr:MAG TPA: hypothetical protein [Caudoviricetes sp.]